MIKIIHLISGLGIGGAEKQLSQLVALSNPAEFKHIVVSMQDLGKMGPNLVEKNIVLYTLNMKRGRISLLGILKLIKILFKERPYILQTWLYHADLLGLLVGKLLRTPKIIWNVRCSNMDVKYYSKLTALVVKLCCWFSSFPTAIIVNSKAGEALHKNTLGYKAKHWEWIPNGFQIDYYKPDLHARKLFRKELALTDENALLGMVARWDPMKDPFTFLRTAKELIQKFPKARFVFVGHGMDSANLELNTEIKRLGLEKFVYILGVQQNIPRILNALDLLVLPSAFGEGFPNILGEAMACGVLCVATNVGDAALIIEETGKIVEHSNVSQLSEALEAMLVLDPGSRRELQTLARQKIINTFESSTIVKKYETFYRTLLGIKEST